jgi:hypothetical protein
MTFLTGYTHKGKVLINGAIDPDQVIMDPKELTVFPEDDGLQIADYLQGDFEWWYFDIFDQASGCFLKIVLHIGTNPLRTRVFPQLAISVNTPEKSESLFRPFYINEMIADTQRCNISVGDRIKIWAESGSQPQYFIKVDIAGFKCDFRFKSEIKGWKPFGKKVLFQSGKKEVDFSWVIPVPGARVEGDFNYENRKYILKSAVGYHDHNYIKPGRKHPFYMDDLVNSWFWGKCHAGRFTLIFGDVWCRTSRILPLMVAENNNIIHSSNNLIDCSVLSFGHDTRLNVNYPESFKIRSLDKHFPFEAQFESDKITDRKDLLEGVNPVLKFIIKKFIAKPAYHGILAKVIIETGDERLTGSGNFESMVFRGERSTY